MLTFLYINKKATDITLYLCKGDVVMCKRNFENAEEFTEYMHSLGWPVSWIYEEIKLPRNNKEKYYRLAVPQGQQNGYRSVYAIIYNSMGEVVNNTR